MTLENSFLESVAADDLSDLLTEAADIALDQIIESGALDGVPVFGAFRSVWKTGVAVREALYARKVCIFLRELQSTTLNERKRFLNAIQSSEEGRRFGSTMLLVLDKLDDMEKPGIIGRIIAAHIRGDIDEYGKATRLSSMVARSYGPDLSYLKAFKAGLQDDDGEPVADALFAVGLLADRGSDGGTWNGKSSGTLYELSEYGSLLVAHGL